LEQDLSHLIHLQSLDVEIRQLEEEIAALPARQAELEQAFAASVSDHLALQSSLDAALARKQELDAQLVDEQEKHQKFKQDLMRATNEREYTTALREVDYTRKAIGTMETEVIQLLEQIETLEGQVRERTPEMESRRQEVDAQLAAWRQTVDRNAARLAELKAARPDQLALLSAPARSDYERLSRMRSGLALAEARSYSCQACRMTLRPQVFNEIRRGDRIIMCENCGRILYFVAQAEAGSR
jgi:predicted  nucleic acid-binding Zn-ribbon protein